MFQLNEWIVSFHSNMIKMIGRSAKKAGKEIKQR